MIQTSPSSTRCVAKVAHFLAEDGPLYKCHCQSLGKGKEPGASTYPKVNATDTIQQLFFLFAYCASIFFWSRGQIVKGCKSGVTSKPKQEQLYYIHPWTSSRLRLVDESSTRQKLILLWAVQQWLRHPHRFASTLRTNSQKFAILILFDHWIQPP